MPEIPFRRLKKEDLRFKTSPAGMAVGVRETRPFLGRRGPCFLSVPFIWRFSSLPRKHPSLKLE